VSDQPTIHSSATDPSWSAFLDVIAATNGLVAAVVTDCELVITPREQHALLRFAPEQTFNARMANGLESRELVRAAVERVYRQAVQSVVVEVREAVPPLTWLAERGQARQSIEVRGAAVEDIPVVETFLRGLRDAGYRIRFTGRYADYLASDYWRKSLRRADALERAERRCAVCNAPGQLDVHHRTYDRLGYESGADLIALCRGCHSRHHMR
jgi:5-methylcytosine-specific restriction endonuclease McrA